MVRNFAAWFIDRLVFFLLFAALIIVPSTAVAEEFTVFGNNARLTPIMPATGHTISLVIERPLCNVVELASVAFEDTSKTFSVSVAPPAYAIDPCFGGFASPLRIPLPKTPEEGTYTLNVYVESYFSEQKFDPEKLEVTREFDVLSSPLYWFETPQQGSTQSGVGLVRGWICEADKVQIQFDGMPLLDAGYGASRLDTVEICGDEDNGYGLAYAWGLLGDGEHRMRTYIDDALVADVGFMVTSLGEPFITGLSGSYEVQDFPAPGESVVLEWSEAAQNFIIVEYMRDSPD